MAPVSYWLAAASTTLALFSTVFAAPQAPAPAPNACGQVDAATAAVKARNPAATPTVPASVAFACLQSVPNKPAPARKLVDSVKAYAQWQSTLAWLKDPPQSYMLPPVDILGGLDNISMTAATGGFASEYEFQLSILELFIAGHDGHFAYRPDVFKAFTFRNSLAQDLVSVSVDGIQEPKLYHFAALDPRRNNGTGARNGAMPPAITQINGQPAAQVVEALNLKFSSFQDPDSQWNSNFQSYASPLAVPAVAASLAYQGDSITLTYDNGQTKTEQNFAVVRAAANFSGVRNGEDFYNRFCNPAANPPPAAGGGAGAPVPAPTPALPRPAPTISGYPQPVVRDNGANITAGYFLNGAGYDNVAVLSVSGFSPEGDFDSVTYLTNFQQTVETFLAQSKQAGKTRLVIDVSANGGGFVVAGYELFAQLFPDVEPFQAHNLRLSESLVSLARVTDSITTINQTDRLQVLALNILAQSAVVSNLIPGAVFAPDGSNLSTIEQILAPVTLKGDIFSAYQQAPLNQTSAEFNLTGTGTRSNPPPAVFAPENVVLLTDGTCGSTCTLFSYLMLLQLNVKTVVAGGRPQAGPMQAIAGVEGAQVFPLNEIGQAAQAAMILAPDPAALNGTEIAVLAEGYALDRAASLTAAGAVNGKNAFMSSNSQTPLQFLYEPANCRFFYTAAMVQGPTETWKRAVDATWNDPAKFCVQGSRVEMTPDQRFDPLFRLDLMNGRTGINAGTRKVVSGRVAMGVAGLIAVALLM